MVICCCIRCTFFVVYGDRPKSGGYREYNRGLQYGAGSRVCFLGGLVSAFFLSEGLAPACLEVSFSNFLSSRHEGGAVLAPYSDEQTRGLWTQIAAPYKHESRHEGQTRDPRRTSTKADTREQTRGPRRYPQNVDGKCSLIPAGRHI